MAVIHDIGVIITAADQLNNILPFFFAFLFYREAFCYFQEAKLFHYIFLKTCAVMCEVIQLLYSNECTRDQYPFNGQMRTGTGPALVYY